MNVSSSVGSGEVPHPGRRFARRRTAQHVPRRGPRRNAAGAMCVRPLVDGRESSRLEKLRSNSVSGQVQHAEAQDLERVESQRRRFLFIRHAAKERERARSR